MASLPSGATSAEMSAHLDGVAAEAGVAGIREAAQIGAQGAPAALPASATTDWQGKPLPAPPAGFYWQTYAPQRLTALIAGTQGLTAPPTVPVPSGYSAWTSTALQGGLGALWVSLTVGGAPPPNGAAVILNQAVDNGWFAVPAWSNPSQSAAKVQASATQNATYQSQQGESAAYAPLDAQLSQLASGVGPIVAAIQAAAAATVAANTNLSNEAASYISDNNSNSTELIDPISGAGVSGGDPAVWADVLTAAQALVSAQAGWNAALAAAQQFEGQLATVEAQAQAIIAQAGASNTILLGSAQTPGFSAALAAVASINAAIAAAGAQGAPGVDVQSYMQQLASQFPTAQQALANLESAEQAEIAAASTPTILGMSETTFFIVAAGAYFLFFRKKGSSL